MNTKDISFCFVLGIGRSGTTLLQSMLSMHPNICAPIESKLIVHLYKKFFNVKKWNNTTIDNFLNLLYTESAFKNYWNIEKDYLKNKINEYSTNELNFKLLVRLIYSSFKYNEYETKQEIKIICDKNPEYIHLTDKIIYAFPEAKFIHIIRDFRDNVYSSKRLMGNKNCDYLIENWLQGNLLAEKYKVKYPERFYTLKYEDLVSNKVEMMKGVLTFLGIEYNDVIFNYTEKAKDVNKKNIKAFKHFHTELLKPVNTNNIGKWKDGLTPAEINYINYRVNKYAQHLGYKTTYKKHKIYFLRAIIAHFKYKVNFFVIRGYYFYFPFFIRKILSGISLQLFKWFGIKTYYSRDRFRFIDNIKK